MGWREGSQSASVRDASGNLASKLLARELF